MSRLTSKLEHRAVRVAWSICLTLAMAGWAPKAAAQTISSAANQTFGVGNGNTSISAITITEDGSPVILSANDIRIRIPATFNMTWNTGDATATLAGSAAGKVSTTVTFESGNQVLRLNVTSNWVAGDQLIVSGLQFNTFSAASAADNLELVVSGSSGGPTVATDDKTVTIVAPALSSAASQTFVVTDPGTAMSAITVTEASVATITAANDIRIRIPTGFNMSWNTGLTTATITGSASAKVSTTVTYESGGQVLRLNVSANFVAGDQITVSGLQFTSFTATSPAAPLELVISGSSGGATVAADDKTKTIVAVTLTEAANQAFAVADPATVMAVATVTDASAPRITAANGIRLRIPASLNMVWNPAITTATVGGGAAGKVSGTVSYEDAGKTAFLTVTADFAANDQVTISGLQFTTFTAVSGAAGLQLVIAGSGGATAATSDRTKQIVRPTLVSAANQSFTVGDPAVAMSTITITEATSPTITAGDDIRIRIPAGFSMTWNTALSTATIGGAAAAKVSTTVSYEDAGRTLVLNVISDLAANDVVTLSGLQYASFSAVSPANNLELVISGPGGNAANTDTRTIRIYPPLGISSAANQTFGVGNGSTNISTITITDAGTPTITSANDIRIRIPAGFPMTWDTGDDTPTLSGSAAGKVSSTATFESGNRVLRLNVTTSFVAGDQLIVSGLQFDNFTAPAAAAHLELVLSGSSGGATVATDDKSKIIVGPTLSSAANQTFVLTDASTAMSAITVTEAGAATITTTNDIRIRIPTGVNMTWNSAITTATITGPDAAKVSTTVTYESGNKVLRVNVTSGFAAGDQITVSGLQFTAFAAVSPPASLELVISGSSAGATVHADDKTKAIVTVALTETANQAFAVGDLATAMTVATITDASAPRITAANGIRLRIPASLNMIWNTALTSATVGGGAAGKVAGTVSYEDAGKTAFLTVTSDFVANDQVTIFGLEFTNFTAVSGAAGLQLVIAGSGGATAATSDRTKQIVRPTLVSAANQTFTVGDPAVAMSTVTITDATAPTITAADDIRIRVPAGFNMVWNTSLTTATIGGAAAAKVSSTVSYESSGQVLVLNVTSDFAASDVITVSGLQFTSFSAVSAASNLELLVAGPGGNVADTDSRTIRIYPPLVMSTAASQIFAVGDLATNISAITITEDGSPSITATNDIRIRIPAGFPMTWETGDDTPTLGGSAAGKVSGTATFESGGTVLRLNVTTSFVAGDQLTISGLEFANFTAPAPAANLELVVSGSAAGPTAVTDDKTVTIVAPGLSGAANQVFTVANPATAMTALAVTDNAVSATITAVNNIRIRIPTGFNMRWNTAITTATITGSAAGKVATAVTYANGNRDLVLNVTVDFAAGDGIVVSGLQYNNFTAVSAADNLELVVAGAAGGIATTDDKTITIVAPALTGSANQVFAIGDPATPMTALTVTEAGAPTITAANDIRIRIPAGVGMTWNTGLTAATITGTAAGKVSTTVSYETSGQILVLDVTSNFGAGDDITVAGLQFTNFTAVSGPDNLELVVSGSAGGGTASIDNTTKRIVAPTLSSAANQTFGVGNAATAMSTITITDATSATITAANDLRIRIPAGLNMLWNTSLTTATIGGADAAKVSTAVTYENGGQVLVVNVTTSFTASDVITIAGLQFTSFSAVSAAATLELVISGSAGGGTTDTDNRTKTIVAPTLASAANQSFVVAGSATAMSTITITEATVPTIIAANDIRVRIPAGFNMTWNTSLTTATLGGPSVARVSPTVSYEDGGMTLVLNVTSNFVVGSQLTVSGLQFTSFTAASPPANLDLLIQGSSVGPAVATDIRTKTIVAPSISSAANQTFAAAGAGVPMSTITITDATSATITAANDIRIRIPASFNMTWNTSLTTTTIGGADAAKVSSTVSYAAAGRVLVLNVTTSFAASDQITISGLQYSNFTAASPVDHLILEVSNNGGTTALDDKSIQITAVYAASVTPDVVAVGRLPSNGTNYTVNFTVTNPGTGGDSYDLLTATPLTAISVVSIAGAGVTQGANPDSARVAGMAAGGSTLVTVTYAVGNVASGITDTLILTARSVGNPALSDDGRIELTVVRPAVSLLKGVSPNGTQPPGTELTYSVTMTNTGSAAASGLVAVDTLPSSVTFKVGSVVNTLPAGISVSLAYSSDGGSTWSYVPASLACGAPAGFDGCVNRIRWTLLNSLGSAAPDNTGTVEFISRIR